MRRKWYVNGLLFGILVLALSATTVWAQTTGTITGTVVDKDGEAIPGASVVATSPDLMGPRGTATDLEGRFTLPYLPPSSKYQLVAEAAGYGKMVHSDLVVSLGSTIKLNVMLQTEEEVVVTGLAPVISMKDTKVSTNLSDEELEMLPIGRSYQDVLYLAPSVTSSGLGGNPAVAGASATENQFQINGLNTTDPVTGTFGTNLNFNFIREMEVSTGGYEAEYDTSTGGLFNVITKTGSNEFHGQLFGYYDSEDLVASRKDTEFTEYEDSPYTRYDYGFDLGGPIIKDRLWFFVGYNPHYGTYHTEATINNPNWYNPDVDNAAGVINRSAVPIEFDDWVKTWYWSANFTYRMTDKHSFELMTFSDPYHANWNEGGAYDSYFGRLNQMSRRFQGGFNASLKWFATWSNTFFQEVAIGYTHGRLDVLPMITEDPVGYGTPLLLSEDYNFYATAVSPGFGSFTWDDRDSEQLKAKWTWIIGSHEVKFGLTRENMIWEQVSDYSGGYLMDMVYGLYWDPLTGTANDMTDPANYQLKYKYYNQTDHQRQKGVYTALFAQDAWSLTDNFTLKYGLRYEINELRTKAGNSVRLPSLSPRLGFTWDFAKNGKSKLYGSYGKYFMRIPMAMSSSMDLNQGFGYTIRQGYGKGDVMGRVMFGDTPTGMLPGTKNTYEEELVLGVEYEVLPDFSIGARGVYRVLGRLLEDVGWYDESTGAVNYMLSNPGTGWLPTIDTWQASNQRANIVGYPKPVKVYRALEITMEKRFTNNWFMNANYTLSKLTGNFAGAYDRETGQINPGATIDYDVPFYHNMLNRNGLLPTDRTHVLKIQGAYKWDFGLMLGVALDFQSGRPISKRALYPTGVDAYGYDDPIHLVPRGKAGRVPSTWSLDLKLEYAFKLWKTELGVFLEVFNATNNQEATAVYQNYWRYGDTFDTGEVIRLTDGSEAWKAVTARQAPRSARVGFTWSF